MTRREMPEAELVSVLCKKCVNCDRKTTNYAVSVEETVFFLYSLTEKAAPVCLDQERREEDCPRAAPTERCAGRIKEEHK